MFKIVLSSVTQKFLKKCNKELYERLLKKIRSLSDEPYPSDSRRVIGRADKAFRVRVGDYRILYVVYSDKNEVLISEIDKRSRIY